MTTKTKARPRAKADPKVGEWTHRIADALEMTINLQVEVVDADKGTITIFTDTDQCIDVRAGLAAWRGRPGPIQHQGFLVGPLPSPRRGSFQCPGPTKTTKPRQTRVSIHTATRSS